MSDVGAAESPTPSRIRTRFLILSDTHSALPDPSNNPDLPFSKPFPPADVAIHCGDLTSTGKPDEHKRALHLLKSLPAPLKIVIPGNHDLTLDRKYCETHPTLYGWKRPHTEQDLAQAHHLYRTTDATDAGIVYAVEGTHSFTLPNGAKLTVYVSAYTPEFCDWGFAYPREVDRFNASDEGMPENPVRDYDSNGIHDERDDNQCMVMVTHGPPKGILDMTTRGECVGCDHLMKAVGRCRPVLHCFGHIHEGWGSERKQWQDEKRHSAATTKGTLERDAVVESRKTDPVVLTEQQQESVGYIDAGTVKHGLETVFVNASIMDVHYNPCQKPWVVDLMLPAVLAGEKENPPLSIHVTRDPGAQLKEDMHGNGVC